MLELPFEDGTIHLVIVLEAPTRTQVGRSALDPRNPGFFG